MDARLTVLDVMRFRPCEDYGHERVKALWAGRESLTPLEILDLDIPIQDRLWCVLSPEVIGERACRILACDYLGHTLPLWEVRHPGNTGPRVALETAIRYINGVATCEELDAAWPAAWDARTAANAAAWVAAWGYAWDARTAAGIANAAAGGTEREWQLTRTREVLAIEED